MSPQTCVGREDRVDGLVIRPSVHRPLTPIPRDFFLSNFSMANATLSYFLCLRKHVSQKNKTPYTRVDNFAKYQSIFNILSLLVSAQNLLQNDHYISYHTLKTLLYYLVKSSCFKNRINLTIQY